MVSANSRINDDGLADFFVTIQWKSVKMITVNLVIF